MNTPHTHTSRRHPKAGHKPFRGKKECHNAPGRPKKHSTSPVQKGGNGSSHSLIGVITTTAKGAGFVDDPKVPKAPSVFIEQGFLNTALNGDTVEVRLVKKAPAFQRFGGRQRNTGRKQNTSELNGEVVRVISRAKSTYVGNISIENGKTILIADDRKMYVPIELVGSEARRVTGGDKAYIRLNTWTDPKKAPTGSVIRVLGKKGVNEVEMQAIVLEKGFEVGFPEAVEREATDIERNKAIGADEVAIRRDMRGVPTFTIDPFDAKDFDDAISFREIQPKLYEIGVHIADVSHYVRPGTALDKEAVKRGCSVYLVDRTIPMLPEVLSNDVCSLNPHEDKLTFSAVFIVDDKAQIKERWFGKTIINSTHRFTYETAQTAIDGTAQNIDKYAKGMQTVESAEKGMQYRDALVTLDRLAKILQKEKFSQGAIEFAQDEVRFKLDPQGKPIGVYVKPRLDTHKLVEEYMLLANREVARFIYDQIRKKGKRDTGAIYRIHDTPDRDRIKELALFVRALGYNLHHTDGQVTARDINRLLDEIEGTPHESLISIAVIRSMQKAVYSTANIGHFGLAFDFYTHFTSPIRRYPDLLVHRILARHLHNEPFRDNEVVEFQRIAETSTDREIDAADAERASRKLKQVEYMSTRVGQEFSGTISGVTKWGIYIEEDETKSEGMVGFRNLDNDYFVFDERTYSAVGEKTGVRYTLGDKVRFKVVSADIEKRVLDYAIAQ